MSDFDLVLQGSVVRPHGVLPGGYVAVRAGLVAELGQGTAPGARERHVLGDDALILPGAIDAQTHARSQQGQEGFDWASKAAAAGGVTTLIDMPYDEAGLVCSAAALRAKAAEVEAETRVDVGLYGTAHPDEGATRIGEQVAAGAVGFKLSTFGTHPTRFPRVPWPTIAEVMAAVAPTGLAVGFHNEDDETVRQATEAVRAQGITDYRAHGLARPPLAELLAMAQIYETAAHTGCPGHVVHCSLGRGYDLAAAYRRQGVTATAECLLHYLTLTEEDDVARLGGLGKANPPIRDRAERERLWRQLAAGNVHLVATDHVAWAYDRKSQDDMLANASGVPGLEVLLPLFVTEARARGVDVSWAAKLMAANPARHFRIDRRKGALTPGREADIVVLEPRRWRYDPARTGNTVVDWSPYAGKWLGWQVAATYRRGELAAQAGEVVAAPGSGQVVAPPATRPLASAEAAP